MERARKRGPRCSLLSLCLGMGALTVALLARLLVHKPQCPETSRKQRPLFQTEGKRQERSVQLGVGLQLSL